MNTRLPMPALLFDGQLACDGYACAFRLFFALVTAFVLVAAIPTREASFEAPGERAAGGELFALLLVVCLGMNLMAMGRTLLILYLAIEIVSVALVRARRLPARASERAARPRSSTSSSAGSPRGSCSTE